MSVKPWHLLLTGLLSFLFGACFTNYKTQKVNVDLRQFYFVGVMPTNVDGKQLFIPVYMERK